MDKKYQQTKQTRSLTIETRAIDDDARTVEIAFSSEEPYERFYGTEVIDHDPQSVRLDRLNGGAAVLVNHDTDDQVGVVESARIDKDRIGRALLRFSRSSRGQEIFDDVKDGIRQLVSVGYIVHKFEETKLEGGGVLVRATDWEPLELSIVAIPADATVGVGRSHDTKNNQATQKEEAAMPPEVKETQEEKPAFDPEKERNKIRTAEMERVNQIRAMADAHGFDELGREAIESGTSYEQFNRELLAKIGERNNEQRATTQETTDLGMTRKEKSRYSFLRLMDALAHPQDRAAQNAAAFEMEVTQEVEKKMGGDFKVRGAFIPDEILLKDVPQDIYNQRHAMVAQYLRDLSAGTATDGAELVAANLLSGSFIDVLRNAMVTAQAGVRMLPGLVGTVDIPRKTSGSAATWISTEDGDAGNSDPQFDQVSLSPKDLATYTQVTRRLLLQSTPAIEGLVRDDLAQAIGLGLDLAVLHGSGASGQPTGVENQTGINTFNFAAAAPTYAETVRMVKETMTDNALMGSLAYIIDPAGWEDAMTTEKASGTAQFIMNNGRINGYPVFVTNQVTDEDWFFGNWNDVLIGEWGGVELNVDPYTHSLKGKVRYVIFKTADIAVRHAVSFCHCNDGA